MKIKIQTLLAALTILFTAAPGLQAQDAGFDLQPGQKMETDGNTFTTGSLSLNEVSSFNSNMATNYTYSPPSSPGGGGGKPGGGGGKPGGGIGNGIAVNNVELNQRTIAAVAGTVTINFEDGRPAITIQPGTGTVLDANGNQVKDAQGNVITSLADLLKNDKSTGGGIAAAIIKAVEHVAAAVASTSGNSAGFKNANTILAAMIKTVSAADPTVAATLVSTAVGTLTKPGSTASADDINKAIASTVTAATSGSGVSTSEVLTAATTAAKDNGVTVNQSTISSTSIASVIQTTTPVAIDVSVISRSQ